MNTLFYETPFIIANDSNINTYMPSSRDNLDSFISNEIISNNKVVQQGAIVSTAALPQDLTHKIQNNIETHTQTFGISRDSIYITDIPIAPISQITDVINRPIEYVTDQAISNELNIVSSDRDSIDTINTDTIENTVLIDTSIKKDNDINQNILYIPTHQEDSNIINSDRDSIAIIQDNKWEENLIIDNPTPPNKSNTYDPKAELSTNTRETITDKVDNLVKNVNNFIDNVVNSYNPIQSSQNNTGTDKTDNGNHYGNDKNNNKASDKTDNGNHYGQIKKYDDVEIVIQDNTQISRLEDVTDNADKLITIYESVSYRTYNPNSDNRSEEVVSFEYMPTLEVMPTDLRPADLLFDNRDDISSSIILEDQKEIPSQLIKKSFEFGVSGEDLIFSKPIQVNIDVDSSLPDWSDIEIFAKHASDDAFNTAGLSNDSNTLCDNMWNATLWDNIVSVENGQVTFYTCRASTYIMVSDGSEMGLQIQWSTCEYTTTWTQISSWVSSRWGSGALQYDGPGKGWINQWAHSVGYFGTWETGMTPGGKAGIVYFQVYDKPFYIWLTNTGTAIDSSHNYTEMRYFVYFRDDNGISIWYNGGIISNLVATRSPRQGFYFLISTGGVVSFYNGSWVALYTWWAIPQKLNSNVKLDTYMIAGASDSYPEYRIMKSAFVPYSCTSICGDAVTNPGEQCDDGNTNNEDACQNDCTIGTNISCESFRFGISPTTGTAPLSATAIRDSYNWYNLTLNRGTGTPISNPTSPASYTYSGWWVFTWSLTFINSFSGAYSGVCSVVVNVSWGIVNGSCGYISGTNIYDTGSTGGALNSGSNWLCSAGNINGFSWNNTTHTWSWSCNGTWGWSNMSCSATSLYCGDGANDWSWLNQIILIDKNRVLGATGNGSAGYARISDNGKYVVFDSSSNNLVSGDIGNYYDIYVYDDEARTIQGVTLWGNGSSMAPDISADGRYIVFDSSAYNLAPWDAYDNRRDVFLYDRQTSSTIKITTSSEGRLPRISADGSKIIYTSNSHIYLYNRLSWVTTAITASSDGSEWGLDISADGRYISFGSNATNIVPGDTNTWDIFLYDIQSSTFSNISFGGNDNSINSAISSWWNYIAFVTSATNIWTWWTGVYRAYVYNKQTGISTFLWETNRTIDISAEWNYITYGSNSGFNIYNIQSWTTYLIPTAEYPYATSIAANGKKMVFNNQHAYMIKLQSPEQCDDGNTNNTDACSNTCQLVAPSCSGVSFSPLVGYVPLTTTATLPTKAWFTYSDLNRWEWSPIPSPLNGATHIYNTAWTYNISVKLSNNLSWGLNIRCSATATPTNAPVNGVCGTRNGTTIYDFDNWGNSLTWGSAWLCANGTVASFAFNSSTHTWSWSCNGLYGGSNVSCSASESYCGNGVVSNGEQCDDGNTNNTDACSNTCTINIPSCVLTITPPNSQWSPLTSPANITWSFYVSYIDGYTANPTININRWNWDITNQPLVWWLYEWSKTYLTSLPNKTFTITGVVMSWWSPLLVSGEQIVCVGKAYIEWPAYVNECGDGILSWSEQCEHVWHTYCSDGSVCSINADCDGIWDMLCKVREVPDIDDDNIGDPIFDINNNLTNICDVFDDNCIPYTLPWCGFGINACNLIAPSCEDIDFDITPDKWPENTTVTGTWQDGPSWIDIISLYRWTGTPIVSPISPSTYTYANEWYYTWSLTIANSLSGDITTTCEVLINIWWDMCISSPELITFDTIQAQDSTGVYTIQSDYFEMKDRKWADSWYYTTLELSDFSSANGIIPNYMIDWKAVWLTLLDGDANANVLMHTSMSNRNMANGTNTFIYRPTWINNDVRSTYGSKLDLRINIPPYTSIGTYSGIITYTLYEY